MSAYAVAPRSVAVKFDGTNQAEVASKVTDPYYSLTTSSPTEVKWTGADGDVFKVVPDQWMVVTNGDNGWSPAANLSQTDFEARWTILGGA
jgi:sarcosine oxidase gamma subunit